MRFATESELVAKAIRHLPFRHWLRAPSSASVFQAREMKGLFGVPDFVAAVVPPNTGQRCSTPSVAFEMKLSDWRGGLTRAFRSRPSPRSQSLFSAQSRIAPEVAIPNGSSGRMWV